jgi:hypothetical protein
MNLICGTKQGVPILPSPMSGDGNGYMLMHTFDLIGVVVDWLDACRARRLNDLLDLYDTNGSLRCACSEPFIYQGRDDLFRYWSVRLERSVPHAFSLMDLEISDESSIRMSYLGYDGRPVEARFSFTNTGRIADMRCIAAATSSTTTSVMLPTP